MQQEIRYDLFSRFKPLKHVPF
uniref:Uncharacterized protein n=1 Tax=Anguilla anguilla TaxID=7936 RepID=A0A0E9RVB3_ANGAN